MLAWIQVRRFRFHTFVENHIDEILEGSEPRQWRHVPGTENPADDASRGLQPGDLTLDHRWFTRPDFMRQKDSTWPQFLQAAPTPEDPEIRDHPSRLVIATIKKTSNEKVS